MTRLAVIDRKANLQVAGLRAEYCSVHRDRDRHPDPYIAAEFLPELREETEEREAAEAAPMPTAEEFAAWKEGTLGSTTKFGKLSMAARRV